MAEHRASVCVFLGVDKEPIILGPKLDILLCDPKLMNFLQQIQEPIMLALQSKQQIVVALHCDPKLKTLFTYNISNRCWKKLAHHFDLQPGYPFSIYRSPVAVGNTLYWGSVQFNRGYDDIHIHARAYDLDSSTALSTFFAAASITQFFWRMNFW